MIALPSDMVDDVARKRTADETHMRAFRAQDIGQRETAHDVAGPDSGVPGPERGVKNQCQDPLLF